MNVADIFLNPKVCVALSLDLDVCNMVTGSKWMFVAWSVTAALLVRLFDDRLGKQKQNPVF